MPTIIAFPYVVMFQALHCVHVQRNFANNWPPIKIVTDVTDVSSLHTKSSTLSTHVISKGWSDWFFHFPRNMPLLLLIFSFAPNSLTYCPYYLKARLTD